MANPNRPVHTWPVWFLFLPAFVAIWAGWVDLGRMCGFGKVRPLPGIADQAMLNTAITLPIGMEIYGAYALYAWLSGRANAAARRFAAVSAMSSLVVGAGGQVAYHVMVAWGWTKAPWPVVTVVSCIPVAVLGMGAALAHLLRKDTAPGAEAAATTMPRTGRFASALTAVTDSVVRIRNAGPIRLSAATEQTQTADPPPTEQTSKRRIEPVSEQIDRPKADRPRGQRTEQNAGPKPTNPVRSDAELIEQCRTEWTEHGPLSRYRIEQITGASARQAQRVLDSLTLEHIEHELTNPTTQSSEKA